MSDSDLYNLEYLSLVARITQEVVNHTGLNDKAVAEFVISLHDGSKTRDEFKQKLVEVGANFPDSFVEAVDRLILSMHPKHKKRQPTIQDENVAPKGDELDESERKKRLFPGLALKNQEPIIPKDVLMKEVDDMMSQFEGAGTKAKKNLSRPLEDSREVTRRRRRSSRSRSPGRRSPSPPGGRGYDRRDNRRGRAELDDRPVLYKIYTGRVSSLKDFGAFVQLEGIAGRAEGTYHRRVL